MIPILWLRFKPTWCVSYNLIAFLYIHSSGGKVSKTTKYGKWYVQMSKQVNSNNNVNGLWSTRPIPNSPNFLYQLAQFFTNSPKVNSPKLLGQLAQNDFQLAQILYQLAQFILQLNNILSIILNFFFVIDVFFLKVNSLVHFCFR